MTASNLETRLALDTAFCSEYGLDLTVSPEEQALLDAIDAREAAEAEAEALRLEIAATKTRTEQLRAMAAAKASGDTLAAYWAGSASASIGYHVKAGAIRTITA